MNKMHYNLGIQFLSSSLSQSTVTWHSMRDKLVVHFVFQKIHKLKRSFCVGRSHVAEFYFGIKLLFSAGLCSGIFTIWSATDYNSLLLTLVVFAATTSIDLENLIILILLRRKIFCQYKFTCTGTGHNCRTPKIKQIYQTNRTRNHVERLIIIIIII